MRFTAEQYQLAIESLQDAQKQLEADGNPCAVCGDSGHMAWECGHNPLVAVVICRQIAEQSEQFHNTLHYLSGFDTEFGVQLGPAKVVMPQSQEELIEGLGRIDRG
jgi:hypothetical protein